MKSLARDQQDLAAVPGESGGTGWPLPNARAGAVLRHDRAVALAHPLLDDRPAAATGDEEGVVVDGESILDGRRVDLGRHAARIGERAAVQVQPVADPLELERGRARGAALAPGHPQADVRLAAREPDLECPAHHRRDAARMPVETEHAPECLEPVGIGNAVEESIAPLLLHD